MYSLFLLLQYKEHSPKDKVSGSTTYNLSGDDIYVDDAEALEGSGRGGGEVRDDLEASGSGLGPDDEDGDDSSGKYWVLIYFNEL